MAVTYSDLREVLDYDHVTGHFTWKKKIASKIIVGSRAGSSRGKYRQVKLYGKIYLEHRLVEFWMTGAWPKELIDHINGDGHDNRWINLREANVSQNGCNGKARSHNKCGIRGIWQNKGRWKAIVTFNKKRHWVGSFATQQEATVARDVMARQVQGEFAATSGD